MELTEYEKSLIAQALSEGVKTTEELKDWTWARIQRIQGWTKSAYKQESIKEYCWRHVVKAHQN